MKHTNISISNIALAIIAFALSTIGMFAFQNINIFSCIDNPCLWINFTTNVFRAFLASSCIFLVYVSNNYSATRYILLLILILLSPVPRIYHQIREFNVLSYFSHINESLGETKFIIDIVSFAIGCAFVVLIYQLVHKYKKYTEIGKFWIVFFMYLIFITITLVMVWSALGSVTYEGIWILILIVATIIGLITILYENKVKYS